MQESKNFCANLSCKVLIDLDGIWYTVETFLFHEYNSCFVLSIQYFNVDSPTYMILFFKILTLACIQTFLDHFLQTGYDHRDH